HALPLWKAVVVLCFLLRHNDAQVLAAELFEISQPTVSRYGTRLRPVVRDALKELGFGLARLPSAGWSEPGSMQVEGPPDCV
ncbi:MAG: transposase family protein, partial [Streptomycetaceae bacterium]|nr:transposase family protein [Streptomycetaceae bacterium]